MPIRVTSRRDAAKQPKSASFDFPAPPAGITQKPEGVSLCMIVKNEERFLEQCLRSIADVVDEICIVDTGSTDRTIEIAKTFGARVELREWRNDFAWARNEALAMATRRWIIMLDADEELIAESKPALRELRTKSAHHTGGWIRCYNKSDDYAGTGAMSHVLVRVFPNDERIRFRGMIHEYVTLDNANQGITAVNTPIGIIHHGYLKDIVAERGKATRNLEIVKASIDADPSDPFNWFNLGSTAFLMGDYEAARDALEKMREINGSTGRGFIANGLAILAETYCDKLKDPTKGEEISLAALKFSPHYANAHFQLGKSLIAQGRFEEGRAAYQAAIDDKAFAHQQFVVDDQVYTWKAHSEIGSSYAMQQDDASAIEWYRKGLKNAPGIQPLMLNLARALEREGQQDEARELFHDVYSTFRDDYGTVDYVNYLLRRHEGDKALEVIDEALPTLGIKAAVSLLQAAAQIAAKHGRHADVVRYLELAAERDPGNSEILNELERLYRHAGDIEGMARLLEREAATLPSSSADYLRRSYQANARGAFPLGLELARAGLALAPNDEHLAYNAALAAAALGEHTAALDHLSMISTPETPVYVPALALRANVLRSLNRADEAAAIVEQILAIDQVNMDGLVMKAALAEEREDLVRAEEALRELAMINAQRGAVELSTFLMRHGRFEEAARIADAALQH